MFRNGDCLLTTFKLRYHERMYILVVKQVNDHEAKTQNIEVTLNDKLIQRYDGYTTLGGNT